MDTRPDRTRMMATTMHVYIGRDRFAFEDAGMPMGAYVRRTQERYGQEAADEELYRYAAATLAAASHPAWDGSQLGEPAALYNPAADTIYYVMPMGDDGPIFFVSEVPIRSLERWARLPRDGHGYRAVKLAAGTRA